MKKTLKIILGAILVVGFKIFELLGFVDFIIEKHKDSSWWGYVMSAPAVLPSWIISAFGVYLLLGVILNRTITWKRVKTENRDKKRKPQGEGLNRAITHDQVAMAIKLGQKAEKQKLLHNLEKLHPAEHRLESKEEFIAWANKVAPLLKKFNSHYYRDFILNYDRMLLPLSPNMLETAFIRMKNQVIQAIEELKLDLDR